MDRRHFLSGLVGGLGLTAARQWPFRVYSFPSEIKLVRTTYWHMKMSKMPDGPWLMTWIGEWEKSRFTTPPFHLPELTESQMQTMKRIAQDNGIIVSEDWSKICR